MTSTTNTKQSGSSKERNENAQEISDLGGLSIYQALVEVRSNLQTHQSFDTYDKSQVQKQLENIFKGEFF